MYTANKYNNIAIIYRYNNVYVHSHYTCTVSVHSVFQENSIEVWQQYK